MKYPKNAEIQNLVQILKQKICQLRELKGKWLDILLDKNLYKDVEYERCRQCKGSEIYAFLDREYVE